MNKHILLGLIAFFSSSVYASNIPPVAVISSAPNQTWFYNLEDVVFTMNSSYDTDGYINYTKWYINGVYQNGGSYAQSMSKCFALDGSPANGCYQLASGVTTVQVKLEVRDNQGEWSSQTKTYTIQVHKGRKYFVKDHLGNIRTTVNRDGNVLGYDDYYPFGLTMPGRSSNSANPNDNYKFTGHERDDEAGLTLDYMMARNYDPVLGRFLQIDPLAAKFPSYSPYNYTFNNPIRYWDPDGRAPFDGYKDGNGNYVWVENMTAQQFKDDSGVNWERVTGDRKAWDEATTVRDANVKALTDLGNDEGSVKKDVSLYDGDSELFTKLSKLDNADSYTSDWDSKLNSETGTSEAKQSKDIGKTGLALKFYPTKGGTMGANALGLVKTGTIAHIIEAGLEAFERAIGAKDDSIKDMHHDNAKEYLKERKEGNQ